MNESIAYVGLDVHKDSIAVAVAHAGRERAQYLGEIPANRKAVEKLVRRLRGSGQQVEFCYEAGPSGYGLYRDLQGLGQSCAVVAPSLIPRKAGERVKTDRRDAQSLAQLHRAGQLTGVWVPDEEQEALRDLVRAREDVKELEKKSRQRLSGFLLRHNRIYRGGKRNWTKAHWQWLETVGFELPAQQQAFEMYKSTVRELERRVGELEQEMRRALEAWSLRPVVEALMALRGVGLVTAMTVLAELGDLTRFDSPRQLMDFLGLTPSEHSSGNTRRQGGITKSGNGHVRRVLVEAGWNYQYSARRSSVIERRAEKTSQGVQAIAWQAQRRLCGRYRALLRAGKHKKQAVVAVARELVGFIWAIACEVQGRPHASRATGC
jgi:transposase